MLHVYRALVFPGRLGERNLSAFSEVPENSRRQVGGVCDEQSTGDGDICRQFADCYLLTLTNVTCHQVVPWLANRKVISLLRVSAKVLF